jgi:hypothetical protein
MFSLKKKIDIVVYLALWLFYAAMHAFSMYFIVDVSFGIVIFDAILHGALFGITGILLWTIFQYGNFTALSTLQQIINYTALALLTIIFCIGISYLIEYIVFKKEIVLSLSATLPVKGMIGIMLYLILMLSFRLMRKTYNNPENKTENAQIIDEEQHKDSEKEFLGRITVKTKQKLYIFPVEDIFYIQSDGDYVQIITKDGKFLKEQTMKHFELHLPQNLFIRIHRSYLVNVSYILRVESDGKQNYQIVLQNGDYLKASLSGYKLLRFALGL